MGKRINDRTCYRRKRRHKEKLEEINLERLYMEAQKLNPDYINTVEGQMYGNLNYKSLIQRKTLLCESENKSFFSRFYPSAFFSWLLV